MIDDHKHVSLPRLEIIKEYVDRKNMEILDGFGLITSENGVMGLRVKSGKLQYKQSDGTWTDISETGGSGENPSDIPIVNKNDIDNLFS